MTPRERIADLYQIYRQERTFEEDISLHRLTGYVIERADFFLMGRPVCREAPVEAICCPFISFPPEVADAWFLWAFSGDLVEVFSSAPYFLPYVGWIRRGRHIRWYDCLVAKRAIERVGRVDSSLQKARTVVSFA